MNGPEHYKEAEKLTAQAHTVDPEFARYLVAKAQVHATLALAAAAAGGTLGQHGVPSAAWSEVSQ